MNKLSFSNLISANQINQQDIETLISLAQNYRLNGFKNDCQNKILASLFFEASTRTRFSFESAIYRLGGNVITLEQGNSSSTSKGESLSDTGRIFSRYADIIVIRHPEVGSADDLAKFSTVPIINAGDGVNQHPTQALVDIYTIFCEKERLENLNIGIVGDLKNGRAVHSLLEVMSLYKNNHFTLISEDNLKLDPKDKKKLNLKDSQITETSNLDEAIADLDIIYVTRIQKERFANQQEYQKVKNCYRLQKNHILKGKKDLIIMHPLPRVNEIDPEIDDIPQAKYFTQADYGVYIRMALLSLISRN